MPERCPQAPGSIGDCGVLCIRFETCRVSVLNGEDTGLTLTSSRSRKTRKDRSMTEDEATKAGYHASKEGAPKQGAAKQ